MTLHDALNAFILDKRLAGLSDQSIDDYRMILSIFLRFAGSDAAIEDLTFERVSEYVLDLFQRPLSRSTVATYIRNLRIFLRWCSVEHGLSFDPARIKIPRSPKKIVHIYSDTEIRYIFSCVKSSIPWITVRNQTLIAFMLDSGIRQGELCSLDWVCIDRGRMVMKVTGKGAKDRLVPIGSTAIQFLDVYAALCPFHKPYVFVDRSGNRLTKNAVRLFTYRLQEGLPFDLSSHRLRHNFATNFCIDQLRRTGKTEVYDLSILMGHESIETTRRYEHFAHEILAVEHSVSHLDYVYDQIPKTENKKAETLES